LPFSIELRRVQKRKESAHTQEDEKWRKALEGTTGMERKNGGCSAVLN
jgi:hypothetical protein